MKPTRRIAPIAVALAALSVFMALPSLAFAQTPVPPVEPTVLTQLLGALSGGHYLGLIMIATLYLRKLASPASGFPLDIPTPWLPSVSAFGGLAYGFEASLQAGQGPGAAALQALAAGAASGFFDGLLTAIFNHGAAPKWAQAIVFLVDDVAGGTGGGAGGGASSAVRPAAGAPSTGPSLVTSKRLGLAGLAATVVMLVGCGTPLAQTIEKTILTDLENGSALSFIEAAVVALDPALANDMASVDSLIQAAIVVLESTGAIPVEAQANVAKVKAVVGAKLAAAKASGWVMPAVTQQRIASILAGHNPQIVASVLKGARL